LLVAALRQPLVAEGPPAASASRYTLHSAPTAAFAWFPTLPHVGEPVTMVSTSTDLASPITKFAWDLSDFGVFTTGGPAIRTTFTTPAVHVVRLRVTAADGLSAIGSEAIHMSPSPSIVMHPFPIVRIVGVDSRIGIRITVLAVKGPTGASIAVGCRGGGCPRRSTRQVIPASRAGRRWITFRRFERQLRPGARLAVRVSRGSEIGAYTLLKVHHKGLPERVDSCLDPNGITPIRCPS
jgi:hypothetical protein